jgi:hypothetical protein
MPVLTLPKSSKVAVLACVAFQIYAFDAAAHHWQGSYWIPIVAFFIGGFVTDWLSGLFHFSFDYVWPPQFPIMGPIAVEFQEHHAEPTLDPSALATNLTKGAYGALPLAVFTILAARWSGESTFTFLIVSSMLATSVWMLGFHQIHAYAHMGSRLSPEEFNQAVADISRLSLARQKAEFVQLFERVGIPPSIRFLQRCRLFLRPEIHWQHHISFETDFSSVNGWSDPVMNPLYRFLVRRIRASRKSQAAAA